MLSLTNIRAALSSTKTLARDDRGLSTVEYVIVLVLIAAVAMGTWQTFGARVKAKLFGASEDFDLTVNHEEEAP